VPEQWNNAFVEARTLFGGIEANATILNTSNGVPIHVPKVVDASPADNTGQNPLLIAEEGTYTESEDTLDEAILNAYKYGHIVKAADELVSDSMFDIDSFVRSRGGRAIGLRTGERFAVADGTNKPNGIVTAATVGKTFASATVFTADELIDVQHSVPVPYRPFATWLMNDTTVKAVRKLKGQDSQYIWQPGLQAGQPDVLLGSPLVVDPFIASPGASAKPIVYGDLKCYWVRRNGPARILPMVEKYADNGQVGYRLDIRVDGDLVDTTGVKSAAHPAT
jgi:HK97 family phage major capsid protein